MAETAETTSCMNRRYWARRMIDKARGAELPSYGSSAWLMLPDGDPRKVGAVIVAAEAWAQAGDTLELDLRRELANRWFAEKHADDADYAADMLAHRERWQPVARRFARLAARREAGPPRPGKDHAGGPVEWSGGSK